MPRIFDLTLIDELEEAGVDFSTLPASDMFFMIQRETVDECPDYPLIVVE